MATWLEQLTDLSARLKSGGLAGGGNYWDYQARNRAPGAGVAGPEMSERFPPTGTAPMRRIPDPAMAEMHSIPEYMAMRHPIPDTAYDQALAGMRAHLERIYPALSALNPGLSADMRRYEAKRAYDANLADDKKHYPLPEGADPEKWGEPAPTGLNAAGFIADWEARAK